MRFPGSGKTEWAKMVMCAEIKAISRRTPELPLSPGRMVTLDGPRNRQGGSCRPLITVYCQPHRSQVQLWPLAVFTGVHHSVFLLYPVKQSRRVIGLLGVLLTASLQVMAQAWDAGTWQMTLAEAKWGGGRETN